MNGYHSDVGISGKYISSAATHPPNLDNTNIICVNRFNTDKILDTIDDITYENMMIMIYNVLILILHRY